MHYPGTLYFVTTRCFQATFLLRPDPKTNETLGWWLARALERHPGVRLAAIANLSNHLHMLVEDRTGDLAPFMQHFLGNAAKAINELRTDPDGEPRDGKVFHRRYSAEPVLGRDAALDRLLYLLANPTKADLVDRLEAWPGLVLWARSGEPERRGFTRVDNAAYERAKKRATKKGKRPPRRRDYARTEALVVHPLSEGGRVGTHDDDPVLDPAHVLALLRQREAASRAERGARPPLGAKRVLAQRTDARPRSPKRSPRPLCHAASRAARIAFKELYRDFVNAFREASHALRHQGELTVPFPDWSYPPGRGLARAAPS